MTHRIESYANFQLFSNNRHIAAPKYVFSSVEKLLITRMLKDLSLK